MEIDPDRLPTQAQLRELGFTRLERTGLFVKDVLFGQSGERWPSTDAALQRIVENRRRMSEAPVRDVVQPSDSAVPGL